MSIKFGKFLDTDAGKELAHPEIIARIKSTGTRIDTQNNLNKFVMARWPDDYGDHWRFESGTPFGRAAMKRLWSGYLAWGEVGGAA
jgi:hypothetical protein